MPLSNLSPAQVGLTYCSLGLRQSPDPLGEEIWWIVGGFTSGHLTWSEMDNGQKVKTLGTLEPWFLGKGTSLEQGFSLPPRPEAEGWLIPQTGHQCAVLKTLGRP